MHFFKWLSNTIVAPDDAQPSSPATDFDPATWIMNNTDAPLVPCDVGPFPTPEGKVVFLDPLCFSQPAQYIEVPTEGARIVVFHDTRESRNSKLALIFTAEHVAGGADVGSCFVYAGMASIFTPKTHAAMTEFCATFGSDENVYDNYLDQFDDPEGGERKLVALPDGTPLPYVHSGWGDGGYAVFALHDVAGNLCAVYVDFMGCNDDGEYLIPPGVTLDEETGDS